MYEHYHYLGWVILHSTPLRLKSVKKLYLLMRRICPHTVHLANVYLATFFFFFSWKSRWQLSNLLYHISSLSSAKEFDEAGVAVWFVVLLFEAPFAEGFQAEVAHQMLWMKLGTHCSDTAPQDGLLACLAHTSSGLVVVSFTQGLSLMLKETPVHKWAIAFPTNKALRMPQNT